MPENKIKKYIISCYTTTNYYLTVSAPSRDAARQYYYSSDGSEFHQGEEDGWDMGDIEEVDVGSYCPDVDVAVNNDGDEVVPEELPDDCGG
tara:strand:- start:61 stop:333 length:273 start_codon:yes stop_codon:yes gene_type:complete